MYFALEQLHISPLILIIFMYFALEQLHISTLILKLYVFNIFSSGLFPFNAGKSFPFHAKFQGRAF